MILRDNEKSSRPGRAGSTADLIASENCLLSVPGWTFIFGLGSGWKDRPPKTTTTGENEHAEHEE
jgi:hypothetical protein